MAVEQSNPQSMRTFRSFVRVLVLWGVGLTAASSAGWDARTQASSRSIYYLDDSFGTWFVCSLTEETKGLGNAHHPPKSDIRPKP